MACRPTRCTLTDTPFPYTTLFRSYSRPGMEGANRKIKGTIHWVDATRAVPAEIRLYDRLFSVARPDDESDGKTYRDHINPDSRTVVQGYVEPAARSEEHTSELQSLMSISYALLCLIKHTLLT